jgi:hypothetical protein
LAGLEGFKNPKLRTALKTGGDTRPIRAEISSEMALARAAAAAKAKAKAEEIDQATVAAEIEATAAALTAQAVDRITATLRQLQREGALPDIDAGPIDAAARYVASTQATGLAAAQAALADAEDDVRQFGERLAALQAKRQGIMSRRLDGEDLENDALDLHLIDADITALSALAEEARETVTAARRPASVAAAARDRARSELCQAEAASEIQAVAALVHWKADGLEVALRHLAELHSRTGGRPLWAPSMTFYQQVRKAAAAAHLL